MAKKENKAAAKAAKAAQAARAKQNEMMQWLGMGLGLLAVIVVIAFFAIQSNTSVASSLTSLEPNDNFSGSENAPVVIVEYSDFQCPACRAYYPLLDQVKEKYPEDVLFIYRHFPLSSIHALAELAARASEAAAMQDSFFEMHDWLFDNQSSWSSLSSSRARSSFISAAGELGLDIEKFESDMDSKAVKDKVNNDYRGGLGHNVNGTPTVFFNGNQPANRPNSIEAFDLLIENTLN